MDPRKIAPHSIEIKANDRLERSCFGVGCPEVRQRVDFVADQMKPTIVAKFSAAAESLC